MLTEKQKAWDATKATDRENRRRPMTPSVLCDLADNALRAGSFYHDPRRARGVRTPVMPSGRFRGQCANCPHGWKHHSKAGNCRRDCMCGNGAKR
jgi:hypothetical protein